ncbi:uncharacterized protein AKAW2_60706S [Aspergillus luchuensis]|uniref:MIT domain-containing protein n=1 Tax=Aspergillus kawachii TaxID=1069201 RepID=A0A146FYL1_ASPKA|nr:uncharacterized protein AKAW2_60706S [Aspergillus luchuensis]BCS02442.1 hypothetical protein AKAW2_60706S [Aspergillus luchuensis]BCS14116.1 hypothetical protein ALUC_60672S [Aspergillus luchuensis]GAA86331.1 hypothetical protein AKAW_04445 [Aspergillus luchuensis IFO 4308]GAT30407.1 hypothetical protein RIB2604_03303890 [Aspergillus luchuensis]
MSRLKDSDTADYISRIGSGTPANSASPQTAVSLDKTDKGLIREGLGNLNRWSQSTTSSQNSPENNRRLDFTRVPRSPSPTTGHDEHIDNNDGSEYQSRIASETGIEIHDGFHMPETFDTYDGLRTHRPFQTSITSSYGDPVPNHPVDAVGATVPQTNWIFSEATELPHNLFQDPWVKENGSGPDSPRGKSSVVPTRPVLEAHSPRESGPNAPAEEGPRLISEGDRSQEKRKRGQSQKAMLSKALQKANTAVLLDNAANFEGAMEAYNDACQLLHLVMLRSDGGEDEKQKLQEIRDTYMVRVTELQRMDFSFRDLDSKALPERPLSQESYGDLSHPIVDENDVMAREKRVSLQRSSMVQPFDLAEGLASSWDHQPRQSLLPSPLGDRTPTTAQSSDSVNFHHPGSSRRISKFEYMGASDPSETITSGVDITHAAGQSDLSSFGDHKKDVNESTSWLDTIDESGASSPASIRSEVSSIYLRHRGSFHHAVGTEAEFDAALDAAVEAAYDEGLEPAVDLDDNGSSNDIVANARRNVEIAKQKVREAEREAQIALTRGQETQRLQEQPAYDGVNDIRTDYLDEEAEEEERLLEEMTRGYVMDDFEFGIQSKSALPRQSRSGSLSSKLRDGSTASNTMTALSPLAEDTSLPFTDDTNFEPSGSSPPSHGALSVSTNSGQASISTPTVRARRLSGQYATELKIETNTDPFSFRPPPVPKDSTASTSTINHQPGRASGPASALRSAAPVKNRNVSIGSFNEDALSNAISVKMPHQDDDGRELSKVPSPTRPIGKVPSAPDNLGKLNTGLGTFRLRNISVSGPEPFVESPNSPSSNAFPAVDIHKMPMTGSIPIIPTPTTAMMSANGLPSGGLNIFDSHIHSPTSPGSPNLLATDPPLPLEPCPESFLLRPFWLMRCIYQTISHPRGGYLSTKLFIPRDVWRVKNVKIKAVEEKVSNCDLLTAALLKLAKVDTYDADAVLEEMQSLESVLDQVQMSLSKKIGSEVGVQGAMPLFKSAQSFEDPAAVDAPPSKPSNVPSKSYLTSWRKLRSKNSGVNATASLPASKDTNKDNATVSTIPMTSLPTSQPLRRRVSQLHYNGSNNYMGALARLCDAAQVLDQIAQQVEDPGLRHSSPTLVGLELSTRHAAEFFGLYVCRFALNDIGMMLDKFIKRGSEWVLI